MINSLDSISPANSYSKNGMLIEKVFSHRSFKTLIKRLKSEDYEVDLLSNLRPIDYNWLSKNMNLSLFDKMFLSYQLGMSKPDKEIFKHIIDALGTTNIYFLDDSSKNIEAAQSLGIQGIQITGDKIDTIQITDNGISKILLPQIK